MHKTVRKKFERRRVVVRDIYNTLQADLIDYQKITGSNNNYRYILVVIDALSRFAWTAKLLDKKASTTAAALDEIIGSMPRYPIFFSSDQGNEFNEKNQHIRSILVDKYHMHIFTMKGLTKGSIVERFNRTLKTRLARFFTENKTKRWIDQLQNFTRNYNRTYHTSIKMAPVDVTNENVKEVLQNVYPKAHTKSNCSAFKLGDKVRIPRSKNVFSKGYEQSKL